MKTDKQKKRRLFGGISLEQKFKERTEFNDFIASRKGTSGRWMQAQINHDGQNRFNGTP